ncbi:MAG: hypothetical protein ACRESZ_19975 [Methylococcales bacterium]
MADYCQCVVGMPGTTTGSLGHAGYLVFGQTKNPGTSTVACLLSFNDLVTVLVHLPPRRQLALLKIRQI